MHWHDKTSISFFCANDFCVIGVLLDKSVINESQSSSAVLRQHTA